MRCGSTACAHNPVRRNELKRIRMLKLFVESAYFVAIEMNIFLFSFYSFSLSYSKYRPENETKKVSEVKLCNGDKLSLKQNKYTRHTDHAVKTMEIIFSLLCLLFSCALTHSISREYSMKQLKLGEAK